MIYLVRDSRVCAVYLFDFCFSSRLQEGNGQSVQILVFPVVEVKAELSTQVAQKNNVEAVGFWVFTNL